MENEKEIHSPSFALFVGNGQTDQTSLEVAVMREGSTLTNGIICRLVASVRSESLEWTDGSTSLCPGDAKRAMVARISPRAPATDSCIDGGNRRDEPLPAK